MTKSRLYKIVMNSLSEKNSQQLQILGEQISVPVCAKTDGTKPPQIAREALERAKHLLLDVLIVDTAGRLHTKVNLMQELKKKGLQLHVKEEKQTM